MQCGEARTVEAVEGSLPYGAQWRVYPVYPVSRSNLRCGVYHYHVVATSTIQARTDEPPVTGDRSHPAQKLHPQDRLVHHDGRISSWVTKVILLVLVGGTILYYVWPKQTYNHVYKQLGLHRCLR
jgi:hypothetical protein